MKKVQKWDFKKHCYEDALIDDECSLYEIDMNKIVKCPNCNKEVIFGDCYTSKQYHSDYGFGYAVCEECYEKERKQEIENKGR